MASPLNRTLPFVPFIKALPVTVRVSVISTCAALFALLITACGPVAAEEPAQPAWKYSSKFLRPFWEGETVVGESALFIQDSDADPKTGEARASVLFPIRKIVAVRNSAGDTTCYHLL
jgi:hypothetical protein